MIAALLPPRADEVSHLASYAMRDGESEIRGDPRRLFLAIHGGGEETHPEL